MVTAMTHQNYFLHFCFGGVVMCSPLVCTCVQSSVDKLYLLWHPTDPMVPTFQDTAIVTEHQGLFDTSCGAW